MTHLQGCADRCEAVAALVMGALPLEEAAALEKHLASCQTCRRLYESLRREEEDLLWAFGQIGCGARDVVTDRLAPAPADRGQGRLASRAQRPLREFARLRTGVKVAMAAAVLAGAVGVWAWSRQPGTQAEPSFAILAQPAYATVLQEIDNARSVRYVRTHMQDDQSPWVGQQTVRDGGLMRTVMPDGRVMIDDVISGEGLTLHTRQKSAFRRGYTPLSRTRYMNMADSIRTLHEHKGVFAGQELLDGTLTNIYKVEEPYEKITIWANAWTHLPLRLERVLLPCTGKGIRMPRMDLRASDFTDDEEEKKRLDRTPDCYMTVGFHGAGMHEAKTTIVLSDFEWNIDCDDSLFSLTPPAGYTVIDSERYDALVDERSLLEALRFWAETSNGRFPEDIGMLADCRPQLVRKYRRVGSPQEAFRQAAPMLDTVLAGLTFAQELKVKDNWHYAGKDVTLGEAGKPLCWWQLEGGKVWRVIYADLRTRDVSTPPEDPTSSGAPAAQP